MRTLTVLSIAAFVALVGLYIFSKQPVARVPQAPKSAIGSTGQNSPIRNPQAPSGGPESPKPPLAKLESIAFRTLPPTNKLDRLNSLRENFRALAQSGDHVAALRSAKELSDPNERETALLALVTEWTKGELRLPGNRAQSIAEFGLDAALGMELAAQPELAKLWASEMTEGEGRAAILRQVAKATVATDPASAFALLDEMPENTRARFMDEVFQYWGRADTTAAINWANQLPDADKENAVKSIRQVAPVGIGAVLRERDNYTVIDGFVPGSPAELSGKLQPGDRLLAIAEGNNQFTDAKGLKLQDIVQMIRGAPDTSLQLRVVNEAAPNAAPRTVTITRGQITFKNNP